MTRNAPESRAGTVQDSEQGQPPTELPPDDKGPQNPAPAEPEQFSRDYVERLREEARANRLAAQRADYLNTEVRRLATREATRGILTDPEALTWSADFENPETGLPDHDRIHEAAEALAKASPWLARPRGPLQGQGEHTAAPAGLSLSELLRA